MKKKITVSVILALLSTFFVFIYLYDIEQKNKSMSEPVKVVVADVKIEQGKIITASMLKEKFIPKQYAQPKHISAIKDFYVDKNPSFMSIVAFEEGEQITSAKILPITSDAGISNTIPDNKRAVTLIFERDEVAGIISPGSRIDLISIAEYENKDKNFIESSVVVAQNLLVLAVGSNVIGGINDTKQESITVNLPVTIAVSVAEAQQIMLAQENGVLKIALRPSGDLTVAQTEPVKMNDIFKDASSKYVHKELNAQNRTVKEIQKSQKEAIDILNRYSSK